MKYPRLRQLAALTASGFATLESIDTALQPDLDSLLSELRGYATTCRDATRTTDGQVEALREIASAVQEIETRTTALSTPPPRPTPGQAARHVPPGMRRPAPEVIAASAAGRIGTRLVATTASGQDLRHEEIEDFEDLGRRMCDALRVTAGVPRLKGRVVVAALLTDDYPEERHLRHGDVKGNAAKLRAITEPGALIASGGICAPVAVDYTIPNWSSDDRPIKAGLPLFQADRGGLTFVAPPTISDLADATAIWSETTDANPGTSTKPVHVVTCGDTDNVLVDAIPTRLRFGNMAGRYFPEQVAANVAVALAQAAREAETNLWDKVIAAGKVATNVEYVGATRDLLATIDLANVALRDRHRMADGQRVRVLLHRLFRDMLRADLAREIGHQQGEIDSLAITDAQVDAWLDVRGITPIWAMDSPTPVTLSGVAIPAQSFGAQTNGGSLAAWPSHCAFTIFAEGSFQFLDGGRLDLGVVRDSTLEATNDYETFVEPFETAAFRGVESSTIVVPLAPSGASVGTVAPSGYVSGS
ncbi:MAG TPA: major capsid protein [Mycobacteriales bacterium]|nr:major capsid protein [Mycobacteriales bacterium]